MPNSDRFNDNLPSEIHFLIDAMNGCLTDKVYLRYGLNEILPYNL